MASDQELALQKASLAGILWTTSGFDLTEGIIDLSKGLADNFREKKTVDWILNYLKIGEKIKADNDCFKEFLLKDKIEGKEALEILELANITINGITIREFSARIHLCDKSLKMKAKVTTILHIDIEGKSLLDASSAMVELANIERAISEKIFEDIPTEYDLGKINYICNISSIATNDDAINDIIGSIYSKGERVFEESPVEEDKLVYAYYLLLSNRLVLDGVGIDNVDDIKDALSDYKQSRVKIFVKHRELRAKLINYQFNVKNRLYEGQISIISTLTKSLDSIDSAKIIVTHLLSEILAIT